MSVKTKNQEPSPQAFPKEVFDTLLICDHVLLNKSEGKTGGAGFSQTGRTAPAPNPPRALDKTTSPQPNRREVGKGAPAPLPGRFYVANNKAVGISKGRIAFVGDAEENLKAKKTYRFKNHLLSPGFVNTHTHLPMSLFRGLAEDLSLKEWLENYIFPLESRFVDEDFISVGTRLSALELIKTGVTTFCDMYFYNRALAGAVDKSGLRGIIGVGVPSVEKDWREWKRKTLELKDIYKDKPRICPAVAPHAPYTVETAVLAEIGKFAKEENLLLTIHVSESEWEQKETQKKHGATPVQYLHSLGVTGPNALFVHCVHVNEEDLRIMSETGTAFSYNPESNMKLSSGTAPVAKALKAGVVVGLGTDGSASNNNLNFFGEMSSGVKLQALKDGPALTAEDMFQTATLGGARALNLEGEIGSLEVGKRADLIAVDLNHPQFFPPYNLISHLVHSAQGNEVAFVMCDGRVLMENGQVQTLNEEDIYRESRDFGHRIQDFLKKK